MAAFHVFVDGSVDDSPMGLKDLATAIANHYGLSATELLPRLQKGRFRVKTNADEATAAAYKRDLERLGAICTIEEATPGNSQRTTPLPFPAVRPATPPAGLPTVKPATTPPPEGLGAAGATPPAGLGAAGATPAGLGAAGATTPPANRPAPPPTGLGAAGATTPPANRPATAPTGLAAAGTTTPPANRPATAPTGLAAAGTTTPPENRGATPASGLAAAGTTIPPANRATPPSGLAVVSAATPSTPPPMGGSQFQSGLSAAFSGEMPAADLGALGGDALSVSSLDGVDDAKSEPSGSFGPPGGGGMPASIGPAPEKKADAKKDKKDKPKDEPLDMFAPPDMQGEEFKVDIASDETDFARKRSSTPPPMATVNDGPPPPEKVSSQKIPTTPSAATRKSQPSMQVPNQPVTTLSEPSKFGPLGDERVRFAAGVLLAVLLGFVPAHFIAKMKEESASEAIDRKVVAAQQTADTPELYANLDRMRADQLDRKKSEQRNAAIIGFAVWALCGGGIAFAWFKKIPWDG